MLRGSSDGLCKCGKPEGHVGWLLCMNEEIAATMNPCGWCKGEGALRDATRSERKELSHEETPDDRVVRLLGEAHAVAESGDIEGGLDIAAIAYEEFFGYPAGAPD